MQIENFSYNSPLHSHKSSFTLLSLSPKTSLPPENTLIFLNYLFFNVAISFSLYDGLLELIYFDAKTRRKLVEKCEITCKNITLNYGTFSSEEQRSKKFMLKNGNPFAISLKLVNSSFSQLFLEVDSLFNENKEKFPAKLELKTVDFFEICAFCALELKASVRSEFAGKHRFFIEFLAKDSKKHERLFKVFAEFEAVNGGLLIPSSSNIRFQEGFPGIVQTKVVAVKSSFDIDCRVLGVESADPRIIPFVLKDVIEAHSKEEFLKVVFDPSSLKRENVRRNIYFIMC